jgi:hypothetical protein
MISTIPGLIPLEESQLPAWFTSLTEEDQESLESEWWSDVAAWLTEQGASLVMAQLAPWDFETAERGGFSQADAWRWSAPWSEESASTLFQLSPEWAVVSGGGRQLMSMLDGWTGVTTEQDLREPYARQIRGSGAS